MAAGTMTFVEVTHSSVKKIRASWTSGTAGEAGTASATTTNPYDGKLIAFVTDPGATAPTDDYDIVATDADGDDILIGAGADRDTANTEVVAEASLGAVAGSKITLSVTNAGSAKQGVAILYIR